MSGNCDHSGFHSGVGKISRDFQSIRFVLVCDGCGTEMREGELAGSGSWWLYEDDGATTVLFEWRVSTTRWWMNLLAPVARPVFRWNHDRLMRAGGRGLARRVGAELLSGG